MIKWKRFRMSMLLLLIGVFIVACSTKNASHPVRVQAKTSAASTTSTPDSASAQVTVTVDPTQKSSGWTVNKNIFGKFFEMNGKDTYPGIISQHLANGSFETWYTRDKGSKPIWWQRTSIIYRDTVKTAGIAYPWQPVKGTDAAGQGAEAAGSVKYEQLTGGVNGAKGNGKFQRITVSGEHQIGGIQQRIALPDERTLKYNLSFYIRGNAAKNGMTVQVVDPDGEVLARQNVPVTPQWTKQELKLALSKKSSERFDQSPFGQFSLQFLVKGTGQVDLDWAMLMSGDAVKGIYNPTTIQMLKKFHVTSIRWGGNYASEYHWRDGIGPWKNRPVNANLAWGGLEPNNMGTDEFLEFCKLAGVQPMINIGFNKDISPQEAADWVQYVNGAATTPMGKLRARNGHPKPYGVKLWQVGNEVYGGYQIGHTDETDYAKGFIEYVQAMKAADPSITVIASGIDPLYVDFGNPFGTPPTWNQTVFKIAGPSHVDGIDIHRYVRGIVVPENRKDWLQTNHTDPVGYNQALVSFPSEYEQLLKQLNAEAVKQGIQHLKVNVGEWNLQPVVSKGWPRAAYPNMAHASFMAGMFNAFIREGNIVQMAYQRDNTLYYRPYLPFDMRPVNPGNYTLQFYAEPFEQGNRTWHDLPVQVDGPTFTLPATGIRIRKMDDVPYVDVSSIISGQGNQIYVFATNRNLKKTYKVNFKLDHASAGGNQPVSVIEQSSQTPFQAQTSWTGINGFQIKNEKLKMDHTGSVQLTLPPASVVRLAYTINRK